MAGVSLFGFEISRKKQVEAETKSFVDKTTDDGALVTSATSYGTYVDLDGSIRSEAELVTKYRAMAEQPEIDSAISEITNEAVSIEEDQDIVKINLDKCDAFGINERVKGLITEEFENCLRLLEFNELGYDIFRRWYVDARINYHAIIDEKAPQNGIVEMRYIDPRKIRKIREVKRIKAPGNQNDTASTPILKQTVNEYYLYNEKGFAADKPGQAPVGSGSTQGIKIADGSIIQVTSGLTSVNGNIVYGYLQPAIKPLNALRAMEDSLVIYRLSRAPERRVWYIDVGNLPKMKAEQYLRDIMVKHKNRLVYDASTGEVRDDRRFMTMLEDYWLPRREGGRGTEIDTLPGGQSLGQIDDVLYFQKRLMKSLNVPVSRMDSENSFSVGQSSQISRDEIKFNKFVVRIRTRFCRLFLEFLERQLILKRIITYDDWKKLKYAIRFDWAKDNYWAELKELEILTNRLNVATQIEPFVGKFFTLNWIRKNIFRQTDEEIIEMMPEFERDAEWLAHIDELKQPLAPAEIPEPPPEKSKGD